MHNNKKFLVFFTFFAVASLFSVGIVDASTLTITPSSGSYTVGQTFNVTINLNTAGESSTGVDIRDLNYNPSLLRVNSVTPGSLFAITQTNTNNSTTGKITFQQVSGTGTTYNGSGTLATINFTTLAAGTANLTFDYTQGVSTDTNVANIANPGVDSLTAVTGASLTIGSAGDTTAPTNVVVTAPSTGTVGNVITLTSSASDNVGVAGVQFKVNGINQGAEDTTSPYSISWAPSSAGTYTITATARDAAGNQTTSAGVNVSVTTPADTTPPTISTITSGTPTASSVGISWTTNENTTGIVEYGITSSYGSQSSDSTVTTSHNITLSGLTANTTYHYRIHATDTAGNSTNSTDRTFTTASIPDTQPPNAITTFAVQAGTVGQNSIGLSWTAPSDLPSGNVSSYDIRYTTGTLSEGTWASATQASGEPVVANFGQTQTYTLVGLSAGSTYQIGIKSSDSGGRISNISNIVTQTTQAPTPAPVVTLTANNQSGSISISYNTSATLSWNATNATSCTSSGSWSGSRSASGTFSTGNLTSSQTYTLSCTGAGGTTNQTVVVNVLPPTPTVTLTANGTANSVTISYDTSATLSWNAANATTCTASGGTGSWAGTRPVNSTFSTGNLTSSQTYTISCTGSGGTIQSTVVVNVSAAPLPTLTFTSGGNTTVTLPASNSGTTLTWSSTNTTSCTASGGTGSWAGSRPVSSTFSTGALTSSQAYSLTCTGPGGQVARTVDVQVSSPLPVPTVTFSINGGTDGISIVSGGSLNLVWTSSNASNCYALGGWLGVKGTSGNETVSNVTTANTYTLICTNSNGSVTNTIDVDVTQAAPTINLQINSSDGPLSIANGGSATLSWTSTNATTCTASGGWSGTKNANGSETQTNITTSGIYTLTCTGAGGTVVDAVTINVGTPQITLNLTGNGSDGPLTLTSGSAVTLSWTSTNATTCTASGGWSGTKNANGSETVSGITQSTSFVLACSNTSGGTQSDAVVANIQTSSTNPPPGGGTGGVVTDTTPPPAPGSLVTIGGPTGVYLQWQNPNVSDYVRTVIVRKEGSAPTSRNDGFVVYEGTATQFTDTTGELGRTYYYGLFAFDTSSNYSVAASAASARGQLTEAQAQQQLATIPPPTTPTTPPVCDTGTSGGGLTLSRGLVRGSEGADVRSLQRFLNNNGFVISGSGAGSPGNESTYYGALTEAAVGKFQCARGIVCAGGAGYGSVGPRTRAELAKGGVSCIPSAPTTPTTPTVPSGSVHITLTVPLSLNSVGEQVRSLQRFLNDKGFTVSPSGAGSPGNESTFFGTRTENAVKAYQCARGIVCSGYGYGAVGPRTRAQINNE